MKAKARHLLLGSSGEEAAVRYLRSLGWRILERNWRPKGARQGLELDIVAGNGEELVFVEVKTRSCGPAEQPGDSEGHGIPAYAAFTAQKQERFVRAARHYLAVEEVWSRPCRFDLICIQQGPDGRMELEHHDNVIETGHIVDSGDTAWQPW
ncbi:MAG: YraN family protein [Desulfovibrionaceae bacterium]|nr:YraN family protein [Desulfovibrionaceae bacterium]